MDDWLKFAQSLPEGTHKKYPHHCGPGEPRIVNHKRDGWGWSCFRCPDGQNKGWVPRPAESLTEKLARLQRTKAAEDSVIWDPSLPKPAEYNPQAWPLEARVWLYKAGISNTEIEQLGIYWNSRLARVVLPVRDEAGKLLYWQARTLDKANPRKYLNPHVDKDRLIARYGSGPLLVLTEDLLSAYRVSRAGAEAWSLLGTKITDYIATEIIKADKPVATWLDPDKAGRTNAAKIRRALRAYGVEVRDIQSDKDPKLLTREAIECKLATSITKDIPSSPAA
jgi:hypothetical protein